MTSLQNRSAVCLVACLLVASSTSIANAQRGKPKQPVPYTIVPFSPPGIESTASLVLDLNDQGHAVGGVNVAGTSQAWHFDTVTDDYTLLNNGGVSGNYNGAYGVNNLNQIVGGDTILGAVFWADPDADPIALPALPGDLWSSALAINDAGMVVGFSAPGATGTWAPVGVVWKVDVNNNGTVVIDGPVLLPPLADGVKAIAEDINELDNGSAMATGYSTSENGFDEAVVWTIELNGDGTLSIPGVPAGLGILDQESPYTGGLWSHGFSINNFGDVCGQSNGLPFIAPGVSIALPLPLPRGGTRGSALDINDLGDVVGVLAVSRRGLGPDHAYLWKDGDPIDLAKQIDRKSGWDRLHKANRINNNGVIAGQGVFDVDHRGFLLIPN